MHPNQPKGRKRLQFFPCKSNFLSIKTSEDGHFEFAGLPAGKALVLVRDGPFENQYGSAVVELKAGETTFVDFSKIPKAALKVAVYVDGTPVENAEVSVYIKNWSKFRLGTVGSTNTGVNGIASFRNMVPATVQVSCFVPGRNLQENKEIDLSSSKGQTFRADFRF